MSYVNYVAPDQFADTLFDPEPHCLLHSCNENYFVDFLADSVAPDQTAHTLFDLEPHCLLYSCNEDFMNS